ncbi:hypothetical protein BGX28_004009 [Mortierella sp. GBA30]|nr:hypothetical protein BGX28_004009 [Mortierella sp. GBA30]
MMFMMKTSLAAIAMACFIMSAQAHVGLRTPCGRYHPAAGCPKPPPGQSIDYDINSPIGTHDTINSPICKHKVPYATRTMYKAGETISTQYSVGANHGGGHCQWALSYDDGKTWVVLHTLIRDCLKNANQQYSVPVTIPANAPSGKATFMWLWNNAVGNRELYSNCADIEIKGQDGGELKGVAPLIANYGPNSQRIGEFPNANQADGHELFDKRPSVTITVSGSGRPTTTSTTSTKPTTTHVKPTTTTSHPVPTGTGVPPCKYTTITKTVTRTVTKTVVAKPTH